MPLPFALDHVNLWLLASADGYTLVDCGYGDAATRALWERHFATTLATAGMRRIVATHCHPDHLGNAAWLAARFACTRRDDARRIPRRARAASTSTRATRPATCARCSRARHGGEHLSALAARGNRYQRRRARGAAIAFDASSTATAVASARIAWRVIPGYGHSPEHAALYAEEPGVLIAGDMLLPRISTNVAVWPGEPDGDPLARFLDSLRALRGACRTRRSSCRRTACRFAASRSASAQLRAHHAARLAELSVPSRRRREPVIGGPDRARSLFRRELDLQQRFFAMGEAIAHLNHLWHAGRLHARASAADGSDPLRRVNATARSPRIIRSDDVHARHHDCSTAAAPPSPLRPGRARRVARLRRRQERQADRRFRGKRTAARTVVMPTSSDSARRSWSWRRRCSPTRASSPRRR